MTFKINIEKKIRKNSRQKQKIDVIDLKIMIIKCEISFKTMIFDTNEKTLIFISKLEKYYDMCFKCYLLSVVNYRHLHLILKNLDLLKLFFHSRRKIIGVVHNMSLYLFIFNLSLLN